MARLFIGSEGLPVEILQRHLRLNITGRYNEATEEEVIRLQRQHGLPGTGEADPDTFWNIGLQQLLLLENDETGEAVKELQRALRKALHTTALKIDGVYGDNTERAVRDYQDSIFHQHPDGDLFKIDGIAGPQTLEALKILGVTRQHVKDAYIVDPATGKPINVWRW